MTSESALLRLLTLFSPSFPVGAFSYSHGLEWSIELGDITDEATLLDWTRDILSLGSGRTDAILLRHAHRATQTGNPAALALVNALAVSLAFGAERKLEITAQGRAFLLAAAPWSRPEATLSDRPVAYPIAVGAVSAANGIAEDQATLALLHAFAANLVSAAVRLVPLGQQAGLRVLASLEPCLIETAASTGSATLDDIGTATLRADLASLHHETQYTRLFRT